MVGGSSQDIWLFLGTENRFNGRSRAGGSGRVGLDGERKGMQG